MVTTANFANFQQQLRQEMSDVIQQLRVEVNESISGRMDMLSSIYTALQSVSAKETGKAVTRKDNSEGQTCTCGCKRGRIKEINACQR